MADALTNLGTVVTACLGWITDNVILMTMFVAALIPSGFMVIRKAKNTAHA